MSECAVCGTEENIHIHHIDGDENNDSEDNRIPLCSSHHRKVHGDGLESIKSDKVLQLKQQLPEKEAKQVECDHCGYSWESETLNQYATCPSCTSKTKVSKE